MRNLLMVFLALFFVVQAEAQTQTVYSRSSVKYIGTELDGSVTLRVQGYGRNKSDAKEQAMKNAVWAIIFDGVREGFDSKNIRPLVTEVNARERYEDYFNIFFTDNGEYKKYISLRDTKRNSSNKTKDKIGYSYELTIRVLRAELKNRLKSDNIIE